MALSRRAINEGGVGRPEGGAQGQRTDDVAVQGHFAELIAYHTNTEQMLSASAESFPSFHARTCGADFRPGTAARAASDCSYRRAEGFEQAGAE